MIHELASGQYGRVESFFQPPADQPFCRAVLAGIHPGRVFVDDADDPQAALVVRDDPWCFLGGDPDNDAFNRAVNQALWDREILGQKLSMLLFTCHPQDWHGQLSVVFAPRQPIPAHRRRYMCRKLTYDWQADLPQGVSVQRMDESLLRRPGLQIPDEAAHTIRKWRSLPRSEVRDFGFVSILEDVTSQISEVVSWATVDAVVERVGDAGVYTAARHRRRGLAAISAAAAIEHGLAHGLDAVNWTCAEDNIGSIRTAEKLGLERQPDYWLHYLVFDEAQHAAHLAYHHLENGNYRDTIDLIEQALTLADNHPFWLYHDAARAWAALGEPIKALEALRLAVDGGWTDAEDTRARKEFEPLRGLPEWAALLQRMQPPG